MYKGTITNEDWNKLNQERIDLMKQRKVDFEDQIGSFRRTISDNLSFLGDAFQVGRGYIEHGIDKSKVLYDSLTDEKEQTNKVIAVSSAGLVGLLASYRKGIFKKLIYTSLFSGTVAGKMLKLLNFSIRTLIRTYVILFFLLAICYPQKAKEYRDVAFYISKNKIPPLVKDYTGIDLNEQFKNLNESLPDLTSLKSLWDNNQKAADSTKKADEKKN